MKRFLADTHVILWWLEDDSRLGSESRALLSDPNSDVSVSIASLWEISIKHGIGKLGVNAVFVAGWLKQSAISLMPIEVAHLSMLEKLAHHHKDPFDRMLIAQALTENIELMTSDTRIVAYGLPCIEAGK